MHTYIHTYKLVLSYVLVSGLTAAHDESEGVDNLSGDAELADGAGERVFAIDGVLRTLGYITHIHTYMAVGGCAYVQIFIYIRILVSDFKSQCLLQ